MPKENQLEMPLNPEIRELSASEILERLNVILKKARNPREVFLSSLQQSFKDLSGDYKKQYDLYRELTPQALDMAKEIKTGRFLPKGRETDEF